MDSLKMDGRKNQPDPPHDGHEIILFDGLDQALVGYGRQYTKPPVAVYSESAIVELIMHRDGMCVEEDIEFFDFNIRGLWVGEQTPLILEDT